MFLLRCLNIYYKFDDRVNISSKRSISSFLYIDDY